MIITTDETLIRSILEDETVIQGFNDEKPIDNVFFDDAVYFYEEGVGLFPSRFKGNSISIHAAIPKENRGEKAIAAGHFLAQRLTDMGWKVFSQIAKEKKHVNRYAKMVGMQRFGETEKYYLYRYTP